MKLRTLKTRLQAVSTARLQVLQPATVERKRGSAGVRDRERIKERDCGLCQECKRNGRVSLGHAVDHRIPLWDDGADDADNKQYLCRTDHEAKSAIEAALRARGESVPRPHGVVIPKW